MITIQKKCADWMDGSLFFRGILRFFELIGLFFSGSLLIRLFSDDYDDKRLRCSWFVRLIEGAFNIFPKFSPRLPAMPRFLQGSVLLKIAHDANGLSIPAWGLITVVALTPFLPTMTLAGMLIVVFALALFHNNFELDLTATALMFFIVITLVSGVTSLAPGTSIPIAILSTAFMLAYLLIRTCFKNRKSIDFTLAIFIIAAATTGLVAVYQVAIGYVNMTWVDRDLFAALGLRVYSTFGNPNVYGAYLLLAIPAAAAMMYYAKNPFYKLVAVGITGLLVLSLALTYSRGCYLALAVSALVFVLLIEKRMIVLFVAGLAAVPFVLPASMLARLASIVNFEDTSTAFRLNIYRASIRILEDFWMAGLGQGIEAYNRVYPFYAFAAVPSPHAHNLFLQIFLETGIVGLVVFIAVLACFFRTQISFIRRTSDSKRKVLAAALTAAAVGFLFQGMFDHVFYNYRVMLTFFIFIGIAQGVSDE